jgi:indole-3-glycerol phosphate synthase
VSILEKIAEARRADVARLRAETDIEDLRLEALRAPLPRGFARAIDPRLAPPGLRVIAEVKKASPSRGVIREDFDPLEIARSYARGGAAALSVLTEERHFQGSPEHVRAIRPAVSAPILRKDFIVDVCQVWESRRLGADAILLIAALLPDAELGALSREAAEHGLDVLWEVHDEEEMERVARFEPAVIGINNRDLRTFEVSLETTRRLLPSAPAGAIVVSESGFSTAEELCRLSGWGVHAFLIGESLMRARDPGEALRRLLAEAAGMRAGGGAS